MIDLSRIVGSDWDDGNARKNEKYGVSQSASEEMYFNQPLLLLEDVRHAGKEPRYHALGKTHEGRGLHVTFTLRKDGTLIRVIPARDMRRKERGIYEQVH